MRLPVICGVIDRRMLINYRVDPDVLSSLLPPPFRPQLIHGFGMAGICLIRLRKIRPRGFPGWLGLASENAAHRIAVEWDDRDEVRSGVYVLRRDTNSRLNAARRWANLPRAALSWNVSGQGDERHLEVGFASDDGHVAMEVAAKTSKEWPHESVFASIEEASSFFEAGSLGYSPASEAGRFQGLELRCSSWQVEPLTIDRVRSSLFDERRQFPLGTIALDCALLMRGIEHEWHGRVDLCCEPQAERWPNDGNHPSGPQERVLSTSLATPSLISPFASEAINLAGVPAKPLPVPRRAWWLLPPRSKSARRTDRQSNRGRSRGDKRSA